MLRLLSQSISRNVERLTPSAQPRQHPCCFCLQAHSFLLAAIKLVHGTDALANAFVKEPISLADGQLGKPHVLQKRSICPQLCYLLGKFLGDGEIAPGGAEVMQLVHEAVELAHGVEDRGCTFLDCVGSFLVERVPLPPCPRRLE